MLFPVERSHWIDSCSDATMIRLIASIHEAAPALQQGFAAAWMQHPRSFAALEQTGIANLWTVK